MFVLYIIGSGQVHEVRAFVRQQREAGGKHELGKVCAVHRRHGHPDSRQDVLDTVFLQVHLVGFFSRKTDPFQLMPQQVAQLVLGSHYGDELARFGHLGKNGRCAEVFRVIHQHLLLRLLVKKEVAANTVNGWRGPGNDRQIVRIGERRHHAIASQHRAEVGKFGEKRRLSGLNGLIDVFLLASVDADNNRRCRRQAIGARVHVDKLCHG
ncbi:hypothetical protein D3C87_1207000 [compost metagenome]